MPAKKARRSMPAPDKMREETEPEELVPHAAKARSKKRGPPKMSELIESEIDVPRKDLPPAINELFASHSRPDDVLTLGIDRTSPYSAWVRQTDGQGVSKKTVPVDLADVVEVNLLKFDAELISSIKGYPPFADAPSAKFERLDDETYTVTPLRPRSDGGPRKQALKSITIVKSKDMAEEAFDSLDKNILPDGSKRSAFVDRLWLATYFAGRTTTRHRQVVNSVAEECSPKAIVQSDSQIPEEKKLYAFLAGNMGVNVPHDSPFFETLTEAFGYREDVASFYVHNDSESGKLRVAGFKDNGKSLGLRDLAKGGDTFDYDAEFSGEIPPDIVLMLEEARSRPPLNFEFEVMDKVASRGGILRITPCYDRQDPTGNTFAVPLGVLPHDVKQTINDLSRRERPRLINLVSLVNVDVDAAGLETQRATADARTMLHKNAGVPGREPILRDMLVTNKLNGLSDAGRAELAKEFPPVQIIRTKITDNIVTELPISRNSLPKAFRKMLEPNPLLDTGLTLGIDRVPPYHAWIRQDDEEGIPGENIPVDLADAEQKSAFAEMLPIATFFTELTNDGLRRLVNNVADRCATHGVPLVTLRPLVVTGLDIDGNTTATATPDAKKALEEYGGDMHYPATLRNFISIRGLNETGQAALLAHLPLPRLRNTKLATREQEDEFLKEYKNGKLSGKQLQTQFGVNTGSQRRKYNKITNSRMFEGGQNPESHALQSDDETQDEGRFSKDESAVPPVAKRRRRAAASRRADSQASGDTSIGTDPSTGAMAPPPRRRRRDLRPRSEVMSGTTVIGGRSAARSESRHSGEMGDQSTELSHDDDGFTLSSREPRHTALSRGFAEMGMESAGTYARSSRLQEILTMAEGVAHDISREQFNANYVTLRGEVSAHQKEIRKHLDDNPQNFNSSDSWNQTYDLLDMFTKGNSELGFIETAGIMEQQALQALLGGPSAKQRPSQTFADDRAALPQTSNSPSHPLHVDAEMTEVGLQNQEYLAADEDMRIDPPEAEQPRENPNSYSDLIEQALGDADIDPTGYLFEEGSASLPQTEEDDRLGEDELPGDDFLSRFVDVEGVASSSREDGAHEMQPSAPTMGIRSRGVTRSPDERQNILYAARPSGESHRRESRNGSHDSSPQRS